MKTLKDYEYFRTENGVLYCGDNMEILPLITEPIDLCLTDPPYGIDHKITNKGKTKVSAGNKFTLRYDADGRWDKKRPEKQVFNWIFKNTKNQIICGANYFVEHIPVSRGWVYWDKMGGGMSSVNNELIFTSFDNSIKEFRRCHGLDKGFQVKDDFGGVHPTQKPEALIVFLLNEFSKEKEKVIDLFLGSGTTALACEKLNRRWIGIEISEKYCEIAKKRIEQYTNQLKLFK